MLDAAGSGLATLSRQPASSDSADLGTSYATPRSPLSTRGSRPRREAPPALGADTLDVLVGLGLSGEEVDALIRDGVVGALDTSPALRPVTA